LIAPHIANPPSTYFEALAPFVVRYIARFERGEELAGVIDRSQGY
jgi:hypothetical protein